MTFRLLSGTERMHHNHTSCLCLLQQALFVLCPLVCTPVAADRLNWEVEATKAMHRTAEGLLLSEKGGARQALALAAPVPPIPSINSSYQSALGLSIMASAASEDTLVIDARSTELAIIPSIDRPLLAAANSA